MDRITLAKHILSAIGQYTLSMFRLPLTVARQIDKAIAQFIWQSDKEGRGIHWKSWDSICTSNYVGSLGLRSTALLNQALIGKVAWKILADRQSLISKFFLSKYRHSASFLEVKVGSSAFVGLALHFVGKRFD